MKKELSFKESILIGSLLFGLFFGAGNLIFPVELGHQSGSNVIPATFGFLISGVGLAVLGVVASAISNSDSLYEMAKPVGHSFGIFYTCLLYLTIGPFFAIPRTATVAFEVGIRTFVSEESLGTWLLIFSTLFFLGTIIFTLIPGKIMDTIGKFMTPIFLVLLSVLIIFSIISPMGKLGDFPPVEKYASGPVVVGLLDGYNTMDALASLAFAIIIITSIRKLGVTEPKQVAIETFKSGIVCSIGMGIIYASLSFMGSTGKSILSGENGGVLLSQMSSYYLGNAGKLLLALIVVVACFKTAVGLIVACGQMFKEMFPKSLSYKAYAILFTFISFGIANLGLSQIISLSIPVLMFAYPIAITLMFLSLFVGFIKKNQTVYRWTVGAASLFGIFDFLNASPAFIKESSVVVSLLDFAKTFIPGFSIGLGWVLPTIIAFVIGYLLAKKNKTL